MTAGAKQTNSRDLAGRTESHRPFPNSCSALETLAATVHGCFSRFAGPSHAAFVIRQIDRGSPTATPNRATFAIFLPGLPAWNFLGKHGEGNRQSHVHGPKRSATGAGGFGLRFPSTGSATEFEAPQISGLNAIPVR